MADFGASKTKTEFVYTYNSYFCILYSSFFQKGKSKAKLILRSLIEE